MILNEYIETLIQAKRYEVLSESNNGKDYDRIINQAIKLAEDAMNKALAKSKFKGRKTGISIYDMFYIKNYGDYSSFVHGYDDFLEIGTYGMEKPDPVVWGGNRETYGKNIADILKAITSVKTKEFKITRDSDEDDDCYDSYGSIYLELI